MGSQEIAEIGVWFFFIFVTNLEYIFNWLINVVLSLKKLQFLTNKNNPLRFVFSLILNQERASSKLQIPDLINFLNITKLILNLLLTYSKSSAISIHFFMVSIWV